MLLGSRLKEIRKYKGLTILDVKELSGLSKSTISEVENNITSPTAATLNKFAEALGVPIEEFFKEENEIDYIDTLSDKEAIILYEAIQKNDVLKKLIVETKDLNPQQIRKILKIVDIVKGE